MNAKEKAQDLINKMAMRVDHSYRSDLPKKDVKQKAKQLATIAVEEMIAEFKHAKEYYEKNEYVQYRVGYFERVLEEIKKF